MIRTLPNIIITGTPGTGKTTHAESVAKKLSGYKHYPISYFAKENNLIESYDEKLDTHVVDEDKVVDALEAQLQKGGVIIDWHVADVFPERLIDLVVVLRTDNKQLHERLTQRKYKDNKIQENLDCEIMEVIVQEVRESYKPEIVVELTSNTDDEIEDNVQRIIEWESNWRSDHPNGVDGARAAADENDRNGEEVDEDVSEESEPEESDEYSEYEEEALDDDDDDDEKADYDVDEDDEEVTADAKGGEEDSEKEDEEAGKEDIKKQADVDIELQDEHDTKRRKTK